MAAALGILTVFKYRPPETESVLAQQDVTPVLEAGRHMTLVSRNPGYGALGDNADFGDRFTALMDNSVPTCRSLDRAYVGADPKNFQFYLIDGIIVSENVRAESVETLDCGFTFSDHNPVRLTFTLE